MEPPKARGRAFHITVEEERAAPNVMGGMFLSLILLIMFVLCSYNYSSGRYIPSELLVYFIFV